MSYDAYNEVTYPTHSVDLMEYHLWDVVVPVSLTLLLLALVFTIAVCKYKRCMNMGKDVALRRHRKLWMTCGSLGSELPSRSTTEQSLYNQSTTDDHHHRPATQLADASVQTSQLILSSPECTGEDTLQRPTFIHYTENCSNSTIQSTANTQHNPVTLSFNTIIPSCYPEKCPITEDNRLTMAKVTPNNIRNDNVLYSKDLTVTVENTKLLQQQQQQPCQWKASFSDDKFSDEDNNLLLGQKQFVDSPPIDMDEFHSHKSTERLLSQD